MPTWGLICFYLPSDSPNYKYTKEQVLKRSFTFQVCKTHLPKHFRASQNKLADKNNRCKNLPRKLYPKHKRQFMISPSLVKDTGFNPAGCCLFSLTLYSCSPQWSPVRHFGTKLSLVIEFMFISFTLCGKKAVTQGQVGRLFKHTTKKSEACAYA